MTQPDSPAPVAVDDASNPFTRDAAADAGDVQLATAAGRGDAQALEALLRRHQRWVYNIALRFMLNPDDAADLAQEALVRITTRIAQFEARASFRTWAYRIVFNCFMDARRGRLEGVIESFDAYGEALDRIPLQALTLPREQEPDRLWLVQEAKIGCMLGMLLCLDREQRLVYLLGEICEAPSPLAADVLGMTAVNFRKRLERARADLIAFMNDKCGLVRTSNPCRCEKKTRGFIEAGWVDAAARRFVPLHYRQMKEHAAAHAPLLGQLHEQRYAELFREHPLYEGGDLAGKLRALLDDSKALSSLRL
jgi:RNA polymerase sigma factor (sigma-70 family)